MTSWVLQGLTGVLAKSLADAVPPAAVLPAGLRAPSLQGPSLHDYAAGCGAPRKHPPAPSHPPLMGGTHSLSPHTHCAALHPFTPILSHVPGLSPPHPPKRSSLTFPSQSPRPTSQFTCPQSFFFAGRICGDRKPPDPTKPWPKNCGEPRGYSAGVRQAVGDTSGNNNDSGRYQWLLHTHMKA